MSWYLSSIIAMLSFTGLFLCFQNLQRSYSIPVYLFYIWLVSAMFFAILNVLKGGLYLPIFLAVILIVAGVASWLGNYAYNIGISKQANLGYVESVASIRLVIVFVFSILFLDSYLDYVKLAGSIGTIIGIFLVANNNDSHSQREHTGWLSWALLSGLMFALLILANRYVTDKGISSHLAIFYWLSTATLLYGGDAIRKKNSFTINNKFLVLALAGVFSILGQLTLFYAYSTTPNLAYPTAINNARIVPLFIISTYRSGGKTNLRKILGIITVTISIILLA